MANDNQRNHATVNSDSLRLTPLPSGRKRENEQSAQSAQSAFDVINDEWRTNAVGFLC